MEMDDELSLCEDASAHSVCGNVWLACLLVVTQECSCEVTSSGSLTSVEEMFIKRRHYVLLNAIDFFPLPTPPLSFSQHALTLPQA